MSKTLIISEAASSWCFGPNQLDKAKQAIGIAKAAKADCIKFQWTSDPRAMERRRKVPAGSYDILAWPKEWLNELACECARVGIEFLCTVFLPIDVPTIAPYVKRFKVASLEALDRELFDAMKDHGRPIICSLGAFDASNVQYYSHLAECKKLQCTASYPCAVEHLNLNTIAFSVNEGYVTHGLSDHSGHLLTGAFAVACGAEIVEVHFRLERTPKDNPDYPHSHPPMRLARYIQNIRLAEVMLGDGIKKVQPCEIPMLKHRVWQNPREIVTT